MMVIEENAGESVKSAEPFVNIMRFDVTG